MPNAPRTTASGLLAYGAALGWTATALALRAALDPLLGDRQPYVTTYAGIAFAAWFGGTRAGLLAAALSLVAVNYLFVAPRAALGYETVADVVGACAFGFTAGIVLVVIGRMRAAQARAEDAAARALATQARLETEMAERIRVDEALRASEQRLLVAQQAAEAGAWDLDRGSGRLHWSEHHRVLLGLPPDTPPSVDAWLERVDVRDRDAVRLALERSGDGDLRVAFRVRHPERGERWLASWGRAWRPRDGGPTRIAGITRDVTEEQRAADAVRVGEERLRLVAKTARMAIWDIDFATGRIEGSPETAPLFGRDPDQLADDVAGWARQIHPDDRTETVRRFEGMLDGREYHARYRILPDDGGPVRWLEGVGAPLLDAHGRPVRAVGCVFDVTERMQVENALREQTALLETIVHRLPVLIAYLDTDLRYRLNSESYADWFDMPLAEITGRHIRDVVGPAAMATLEPHLRRALGGQTVRFEAEVAYATGHRWIDAAYVPHVVDGRVLGLVVFVHDVTARRQAEEALRRADRAKDEFLAMLGHELRNPLASVRNAIVTARLDEAHRARALEIADRQTNQLRRLVDDLLDVARVTQGKITLHTERVFLSEVMQRAVEAATQTIDERGQTLVVSLPAEPVVLQADVARIQQVFGNLLANASRYTPPGGRIEIFTAVGDGEVTVRVRDTGSGIPADVLPHVFDLFVQAERPLDRAHGGLGVGLTVVRRLVELHGGRVTAHSDGRDAGSEFTVVLPMLPSQSEEHAPPLLPRTAARGARVLLVEDNADAADAMRMLLELLGHRVRVAGDGPSALALLAGAAPDGFAPEVVVLDIGLPGMDGYEVAQRIRADPATRALPLIALTGYGRAEDATRAAAAGIDRHLVKPVDPDALHGLLVELRDGDGARH